VPRRGAARRYPARSTAAMAVPPPAAHRAAVGHRAPVELICGDGRARVGGALQRTRTARRGVAAHAAPPRPLPRPPAPCCARGRAPGLSTRCSYVTLWSAHEKARASIDCAAADPIQSAGGIARRAARGGGAGGARGGRRRAARANGQRHAQPLRVMGPRAGPGRGEREIGRVLRGGLQRGAREGSGMKGCVAEKK
jgi:hypothetical protein